MSVLPASKGLVILAGNSHPELSKTIANHLNTGLGKCSVFLYSNHETGVKLVETVRGRDVYIIQTGSKNVNSDIMELLTLVYACKTSSARRIVVAMPYLPYCKQSKMRKRGSIVSHLLAKMLCRAGLSHLITMDLHAKEIQGFFDVPVDNLRASPFLIEYIRENISDYRNAVIVAKSPNAVHRATSYAERLRLPLAVIHGEERTELDNNDGRTSPPFFDKVSAHSSTTTSSNAHNKTNAAVTTSGVATSVAASSNGSNAAASVALSSSSAAVASNNAAIATSMTSGNHHVTTQNSKPSSMMRSNSVSAAATGMPGVVDGMRSMHVGLEILPTMLPKEKPPLNVVGDVNGHIAIIVDDMIDEVDEFIRSAELLSNRGAYKVFVVATHGLFSAEAAQLIQESFIDEIIITNTVPHELQKMQCHKISTVDVSGLISEAIRRIHNCESMSYLFRNIPKDD